MNVFSFRAECSHDVDMLVAACEMLGVGISMQMQPIQDLPDVMGEFQSSASLLTLQNVLRGIEDSHVLCQTLRPVPLSQNSLERDRNVAWW